MTFILDAFARHGFRGSCQLLLSSHTITAKQPSMPHARYVRVRKGTNARAATYQLVEKHKDQHRIKVKLYRRVDDGSNVEGEGEPNERITVRKRVNHKRSQGEIPREEKGEEPSPSHRRKKSEKLKGGSKSTACEHTSATVMGCPSAPRQSRKLPSRPSASRTAQRTKNADTQASRGSKVSRAEDLSPSTNCDSKSTHMLKMRDHKTVAEGHIIRNVQNSTADDGSAAETAIDVNTTTQENPGSPFQQPQMTTQQSRRLVFGTDRERGRQAHRYDDIDGPRQVLENDLEGLDEAEEDFNDNVHSDPAMKAPWQTHRRRSSLTGLRGLSIADDE